MTPMGLRRIRRELGLTQEQLAKVLGVDRVTVARWETGVRAISEPVARLVKRFAAGQVEKGEHYVAPLTRREDGVYVERIPGDHPDGHWLWVTVSAEWPLPPRATRYLVRWIRSGEGDSEKFMVCRVSPKGIVKHLETEKARHDVWPRIMPAILEALEPK